MRARSGLPRICPAGPSEEGFGRGGWFVESGGEDLQEWGKVEFEEALRTEALLLGRRSDEWFATRWAARTGEFADKLNGLPKYVVSSTLQEPRWTNATVLRGDVVSEVSKLKQKLDGDIVVYASRWVPCRYVHRPAGKLGGPRAPSFPGAGVYSSVTHDDG